MAPSTNPGFIPPRPAEHNLIVMPGTRGTGGFYTLCSAAEHGSEFFGPDAPTPQEAHQLGQAAHEEAMNDVAQH